MKRSKMYDRDYYERGVQLGISGYTNYRWIPELTIPMCQRMCQYLDIPSSAKILDFGCAKGFIVRALTELGYECYGTDISEYAIADSNFQIKDRLSLYKGGESSFILEGHQFDFTIAKDVFEHIPVPDLEEVLEVLYKVSKKIFCIVPLGKDGKYVAPEYEQDVTHIIREDMEWWVQMFEKHGYIVERSTYRVPGIKDNWAHYKKGNGFITARRKEEEK